MEGARLAFNTMKLVSMLSSSELIVVTLPRITRSPSTNKLFAVVVELKIILEVTCELLARISSSSSEDATDENANPPEPSVTSLFF